MQTIHLATIQLFDERSLSKKAKGNERGEEHESLIETTPAPASMSHALNIYVISMNYIKVIYYQTYKIDPWISVSESCISSCCDDYSTFMRHLMPCAPG